MRSIALGGSLLAAAALLGSCTRPRTAAVFPATPQAAASRERADSPWEAAEYFREQRWNGPGEMPLERYLEARRHMQTMRRYSLREGRMIDAAAPRATFGTWESLGPGNVGGRTRGLVIHPQNPNIMWAGGATGGVWKTTDGSQTWTPLTDFMPALTLNSLTIDPTNPDVLYAGTGEQTQSWRGAGIFKTTDGGATWNQLPGTTTSDFYYVNKMAVSPADSARVYAATSTGLWVSLDAGANWKRTLSTATGASNCYDLALQTSQPTDTLFAVCQPAGGVSGVYAIFRNQDAAGVGTWVKVHSDPQMAATALAVAPSNPSIIYAISVTSDGKSLYASALLAVYRSTSNGDPGTWDTRTSNQDTNRMNSGILSGDAYYNFPSSYCPAANTPDFTGQGSYNLVLAVDPLDPNIVWAGGIGLFRSDDGGANWGYASSGVHPDQHTLTFDPNYNGTTNQILWSGNDGGVYKVTQARAKVATCSSTTTGVAWRAVNNGYGTTQFYHGVPYAGGGSYFGGTQDNGTVRGYDARGANLWNSVFGGDGGVSRVDPLDANTMYYEYVYLALRKSTDGGMTSSQMIRGITEDPNNFPFIAYYTFDPGNSMRLYIGGWQLWRTDDGAANWNAASAVIDKVNGSQDRVTTIAVSPADSNVVLFGTRLGKIYRNNNALAADATTVWESSSPRSGNVSRIDFDPNQPSTIYATYTTFRSATADRHVYKSTDSGATWTGIDGSGSTGLPDVPVETVLVDPDDSNRVYLGTDLGVFASFDAGSTWVRDDSPFANVITKNLVIDRSGGAKYLYAFTYGRGVWRVPLPGGGAPCAYSVSPTSLTAGPYGGTATVDVNTSPGCTWSALQNASPSSTGIALQSPAGGAGSGKAYFTVATNVNTTTRSATFLVQRQTVTVTQSGAAPAATNDLLASAQAIASLPYQASHPNNSFTQSAADPVHSCTGSADFKTAWWTFTAPADGSARVTAQGFQSAGDAGIAITAYPLNGSSTGPEMACVTVPKTAGARTNGTITFAVAKRASYAVEVSALGNTASDNATIQFGLAMDTGEPALSISPPQPVVGPGQTLQFKADLKNVANPAVRWAIAPAIGSIAPDGIYTAPAQLDSAALVTVTTLSMGSPATKAVATLMVAPPGVSPPVTGVANGASFQPGPVAPGEVITLFGSGIGPAGLVTAQLDAKGNLGTTLAGIEVLFDGVPAPLVYVSATQSSVVVPYAVAGRWTTRMVVAGNAGQLPPVTLGVVPTAPALFTANSTGSGQVTVLNQDNSINTPAPRGGVVVLYGTGEGQTNPPGVDGQIANSVFPKPAAPVSVTIGGVNATVSYAGAAPQVTAGVLQLNVRVPTNIPAGPASVVVTVGGASSRSDVTITVK